MPDWSHAPAHRLVDGGTFIVTASTYGRQPLLSADHRLLVRDELWHLADQIGWEVQAWAVLPTHYHFVATAAGAAPGTLRALIRRLHSVTGYRINQADGCPGRRVWFQYWDTQLTNERAYFARLKYVMLNPVHHGLARSAEEYRWCSAGWFAARADSAFVRTVMGFPVDRVRVPEVE